MDLGCMRYCQHCGVYFDWRKSSSRSLHLTFCGWLCEKAENGCLIEELLALPPPLVSFILKEAGL